MLLQVDSPSSVSVTAVPTIAAIAVATPTPIYDDVTSQPSEEWRMEDKRDEQYAVNRADIYDGGHNSATSIVGPEIRYNTGTSGADQPAIITLESPATNIITHILSTATRYWHQPDLEALEIVLGFLGAYYLHEPAPLWLHIVAPPGAGKTALAMAPVMLGYHDFWDLDSLTSRTLISGLAKGKDKGKANSYLHRVGYYGLIYMSDFTTLLAKDYREVAAIAGQLRRIWDGKYSAPTGANDGSNSEWEGRVSWITAMTPSAEEVWTKLNPKGERFAILRWRTAEGYKELATKVLQQAARDAESQYLDADGKRVTNQVLGPSQWISQWVRVLIEGAGYTGELPEGLQLAETLPDLDTLSPIFCAAKPSAPSIELIDGLWEMAEVVTLLRTVPPRPDGKNIGQMHGNTHRESPGRLQHQFLKLLRGWAFIHRREAEATDMRLVRRLALDSIPIAKAPLITSLIEVGFMTIEELLIAGGYETVETLKYQLEELEALKVIRCDFKGDTRWRDTATWDLTDRFRELWGRAFSK
jgi:hypothetical protein